MMGLPQPGHAFLQAQYAVAISSSVHKCKKKHTQMHESAKAQLQLGDCKYNRIYITWQKAFIGYRCFGVKIYGKR